MLKSLALFTIVLLAAGCAKKPKGDMTFLLPWLTPQGNYELREITIKTLASPYAVRGSAAEVYYQPAFDETGAKGKIAETHLTKSGNVFVPLDSQSSLALVVYAQFEQLYFYEQDLGISEQLRWPRKVAVDLSIGQGGQDSFNNAHYFTGIDTIGILPFTSSKGVPLAVNQGIVAHEHFHAHFESQVLVPIQSILGITHVGAIKTWSIEPKADVGVLSAEEGNDIVLRAWNEGLADLFAALYTGSANFFEQTMPVEAHDRDLSQGLVLFEDAKTLKRDAPNMNGYQRIGEAYRQGTALSRLLYLLALSGAESPRHFQTRIANRLHLLPKKYAPLYNREVLDFDRIVPDLLQGFPLKKGDSNCEALRLVMIQKHLQDSFPQCSLE
jgi:hypothetical protein